MESLIIITIKIIATVTFVVIIIIVIVIVPVVVIVIIIINNNNNYDNQQLVRLVQKSWALKDYFSVAKFGNNICIKSPNKAIRYRLRFKVFGKTSRQYSGTAIQQRREKLTKCARFEVLFHIFYCIWGEEYRSS